MKHVRHGGVLLPPLDPQTGHLPVGRYGATLGEIEAAFVNSPEFGTSATRPEIWEGFERWLAVWGEVEETLQTSGLLRNLWLSGSFVSAELDPADLDVTPFVDRELAQRCKGKPGARALRDLIGHRTKVSSVYRVEPFVVWWQPIKAILRHEDLLPEEREYLAWRGGLDDLWQRVRPPGPKGPPRAEDAGPRRGYVEVIW